MRTVGISRMSSSSRVRGVAREVRQRRPRLLRGPTVGHPVCQFMYGWPLDVIIVATHAGGEVSAVRDFEVVSVVTALPPIRYLGISGQIAPATSAMPGRLSKGWYGVAPRFRKHARESGDHVHRLPVRRPDRDRRELCRGLFIKNTVCRDPDRGLSPASAFRRRGTRLVFVAARKRAGSRAFFLPSARPGADSRRSRAALSRSPRHQPVPACA